MKDLGEKSLGPMLAKEPSKKWYPSITVDAADFPGLVTQKIGKQGTAEFKYVKTGERINKDSDGKTTHKIDLELRGMEIEEKSPKSIADAGHLVRDEMKK